MIRMKILKSFQKSGENTSTPPPLRTMTKNGLYCAEVKQVLLQHSEVLLQHSEVVCGAPGDGFTAIVYIRQW